ncbi:MAG: hypothetical protein QXU32_07725 [Nitrososphaerales archaeon]
MVEAGASSTQLQLLPDFYLADAFIFSVQVAASVLAFIVAFHFYKFYRITGFVYLLGLGIGFSFITFAQVLLAADVWLEFHPELFNLLFWLRLLSLSYGFSFLAVSYYSKSKEEDKTLMLRIAALSAVPIMVMIAVVILAPPVLDFPPYNQVDEYFRVFILVVLAYVFRSTLVSIVAHGRKELMYIPAAYALLWLGQFSGLIYSIDGGISAFIALHSAKLAGLLLFAIVMSQVVRGKTVRITETEA